MATITRGFSFGATETVTNAKLHALVDNASLSSIVNADIDPSAAIEASKLDLSTSGFVTLAGDQTISGAKTFTNTANFSTPLGDVNLSAITTANKVSGTSLYALTSLASGAGQIPSANLSTVPITKGGTGQTTASAASGAIFPEFAYDYGSGTSSGTAKTGAEVKICYGYASVAQNSTTAIAGLPFTSATSYVVAICGSEGSPSTSLNVQTQVIRNTASQFTIYNKDGDSGTITVQWIAIGT